MAQVQNKIAWFLLLLLAFGCASPSSTGPVPVNPSSEAPTTPAAPKRLVAAILGAPSTVYQPPNIPDAPKGLSEVTAMVHVGLSVFDSTGALRPQLAEAVPSAENGLWKVLPDGTMETTWKIRAGAEWHDGTPFTADDLVFALRVASDPELPAFRNSAFDPIERAETIDARTLLVRWKRPFIRADQLFSDRIAIPLPKHILEIPFTQTARANLMDLPYWADEFVGLGPYKVKEFAAASHILVQANDRYVLGRPKIDQIEVRTIADPNAMVAALLAGTVDMVLGNAVFADQALMLREQWPQGKIFLPLVSLVSMDAQLLDPTPAVMTNLQFRKAILEAVNRQELADTIQYGLLPPADGGILDPTTELSRATEGGIVRYPYDPRQSAQIIEGLGFAKTSDGFYHAPSGEQLLLELRGTQGNVSAILAIADYLQRIGIAVKSTPIPPQLTTNSEYRATYPAFSVNGSPMSDTDIEVYHSANARTPENHYAGSNKPRYMDPEMDALVDRYLVTIPVRERMEIGTQIIRNVTTNLPMLPLFYRSIASVQTNRLLNAGAAVGGGRAAWNVEQWELQG